MLWCYTIPVKHEPSITDHDGNCSQYEQVPRIIQSNPFEKRWPGRCCTANDGKAWQNAAEDPSSDPPLQASPSTSLLGVPQPLGDPASNCPLSVPAYPGQSPQTGCARRHPGLPR